MNPCLIYIFLIDDFKMLVVVLLVTIKGRKYKIVFSYPLLINKLLQILWFKTIALACLAHKSAAEQRLERTAHFCSAQ